MLTRESIRYHARWVRILCCLAVGVGLANAVRYGLLAVPETMVRDYIVYSEPTRFRYATDLVAIVFSFILCVLSALPRFERPLLMVLGGAAGVVGYVFAYLAVLLLFDYVFPAVAPILALLICSGMLETMAWSEERVMRRRLQDIDHARQQFVDMLVHDLRRRVASVLNAASVLDQQGDANTDVLSTMRAAADRIMLLVNNLLDVRKIEEGKMALARETTDLADLLRAGVREVEPAAGMAGVTIGLQTEAGVKVNVDSRIFSRIVSNLIWNAVQHATRGSEIRATCARAEGMLQLTVANHGPVIPPDARAAVFRAFVSGRSETTGATADMTGLGLSFCRLAVEAHGGTIDLESPWPGHEDGVLVTVTLPVA